MKICFITPTVFNLGGIQRVVSVLASELAEEYEVDILCTTEKYKINRGLYNLNEKVNVILNEKLIKKNIFSKIFIKILRILSKKIKINKLLLLIEYPISTRRKLTKFLNKKEYDIVIGVEGDYSILLAMISKKIFGKTIGWMHNSYKAYFETSNKYYWGQKEIFKKYLRNLNECIVLTNEDRILYKKNFDIEVKTIYNPLSFTTEKKSKCSNKNILFVGRLVEIQKGLDHLMNIFYKVTLENPDWKLIIVGDGPDREVISRYITKFSLENRVELYSHTNNIHKFYLQSSIFVSTSRWEGFGLVITEAMECGLPVVAFKNSGPKEIINRDGENGILIEKFDEETFSKKILELINNEFKRKKIAAESIKRAKDFNRGKIVKEWSRTINNLI